MLLLALATCACVTRPGSQEHRQRLIGSWRYADVQRAATAPRAVERCDTDFGTAYRADGSFSGYEIAGSWRVERDRLIETVTELWPMGGGEEPERPQQPEVTRFRLEWISPDVVNLWEESGEGHALVRCQEASQTAP